MEIKHTDIFGQDIRPGDYALVAGSHSLDVFEVLYLTKKMVKVRRLQATDRTKPKLVYGSDIFKLEPELVTLYLLQNAK